MNKKISTLVITGIMAVAAVSSAIAATTKTKTVTYGTGSTGVESVTSSDGKTKLQARINYGAIQNYSYNYDSSSKYIVAGVTEYKGNVKVAIDTNSGVVSSNGYISASAGRNRNTDYSYKLETDRYGVSNTQNVSSATLTDILTIEIKQSN